MSFSDIPDPNHLLKRSETNATKIRTQRRHTTGVTKDQIAQARQLNAQKNGDIHDDLEATTVSGTMDRKDLISLLKQRYGSEMAQFRQNRERSEKVRAWTIVLYYSIPLLNFEKF